MSNLSNCIILTPIAPCSIVPPCDLGVPRVFSESGKLDLAREVNINISRTKLQSVYRTKLYRDYPFVILMDSDVVVTRGDLVRLADAWEPGKTPCIRTKRAEGDHVVCACCFMSGVDYIKVDYMGNPRECQCKKLPNPFYVDGLQGSEI